MQRFISTRNGVRIDAKAVIALRENPALDGKFAPTIATLNDGSNHVIYFTIEEFESYVSRR